MFTPALHRLATHRRYGARAVRIYVCIAPRLDFVEHRPVKILSVARELQMDRGDVSRAMRLLCQERLLERDGRDGPNGAFRYRLLISAA